MAVVKIMLNYSYIWEIRKKNMMSLVLRKEFARSHSMCRQKHDGFQSRITSWEAFDILYITWMEISWQFQLCRGKPRTTFKISKTNIHVKPIVCHCQVWLLAHIWCFVSTPLFYASKMFELRMGQARAPETWWVHHNDMMILWMVANSCTTGRKDGFCSLCSS